MAELRWILLLAGLVFLAGLTIWELRRPRQDRGTAVRGRERSEPTFGSLSDMEQPTAPVAPLQPSRKGEPYPISAWEYAAERSLPVSQVHDARVPLPEPVQVELQAMEPLDFMDTAEPLEPMAPLEAIEDVPGSVGPPLVVSFDEPVTPAEPEIRTLEPWEAAVPTLQTEPAIEEQPVEPMLPTAEPTDPIVEWPPEEQRHILAVRVVGVNPDRMSGRPLRQALSACGFVHGRFGIFHQPGADGRALVSAANLSKPGVFDPTNMDFERFRGLGLFAVLPGPLPPAAALDHLLDTAGDLAQRLQARLQDEHGMPLDEEGLEAMARIVQSMTQGGLRAEPAA